MANRKISDIEGIGPVYADNLRKLNIRSVNSLLEKGATRAGRKKIAEDSGISPDLILKWVNFADLYRVKGVGSEYSELLEKAGVDTVKELKNRRADNLYNMMKEVNASGRPLVRQLPGLKAIQSWIDQAKKLEAKVTH